MGTAETASVVPAGTASWVIAAARAAQAKAGRVARAQPLATAGVVVS